MQSKIQQENEEMMLSIFLLVFYTLQQFGKYISVWMLPSTHTNLSIEARKHSGRSRTRT